MMISGPDDMEPYGDIPMATMMQAMVDEAVSAKFEAVNFEIRLHQTVDDIVSSP